MIVVVVVDDAVVVVVVVVVVAMLLLLFDLSPMELASMMPSISTFPSSSKAAAKTRKSSGTISKMRSNAWMFASSTNEASSRNLELQLWIQHLIQSLQNMQHLGG